MADHLDDVLAQWASRRPDLDVSPMAVIGRLTRATRLVRAENAATFGRHGLDPSSFDLLATLRRAAPAEGMTPVELTRASMVTAGAITQRLDRMQERGLVARDRSETDGRSVRVSLTAAGRELIDRVLPDHVDTERRLLAALDPGQREELAGLLRVLLESLGDGVG